MKINLYLIVIEYSAVKKMLHRFNNVLKVLCVCLCRTFTT